MLNISYASDDNYAPYLGISLVSLLKNNLNDFNEINIFILNSNISEKNIKKLKTIEKNYPFAKLIFIDVENIEDKLDVELQKFKVKDNVSLANYSRLFLSSLIPKNINKIIYLDCDTLILNSLKPLWQINIDNYLGAGVLALNGLYSHKKEIGLKKDDPYINSGMILINLEKWRTDNLEEKFIETILKFSENKVEYGQDQGIINAVMKDEMLVVNPKYNLEGSLHNTSWNITTKLHSEIQYNYYTKQTLDNAINNPTVMHFCVGASEH